MERIDTNTLHFSLSKKASQSFAPAGAKMIRIIFCGGVYVAENTTQPASVEFVCLRHTNYARGGLQACSNGNPAKRFSFESVSKILFDTLKWSVSTPIRSIYCFTTIQEAGKTHCSRYIKKFYEAP